MTCIVAYRSGTTTWVGGDRCVSDANDALNQHLDQPKVFERMGVIIGVSGDVSGLNAVERLSRGYDDAYETGDDLKDWCVTTLMPAIRRVMKKDWPDSEWDSALMVGAGGQIVQIPACGGCTVVDTEYSAIGSGSPVALGAFHAATSAVAMTGIGTVSNILDDQEDGEFFCGLALDASIHHSPGVAGKTDILKA